MVGRLLNIFDYALGAMHRKKARNFLVFIVFSSLVFLFGSFQLMTSALEELSQAILKTAPDITVQQMVAGRQSLISNKLSSEIKRIFGVRSVAPRVWGYYFDESNGANYTVWGLDPGQLRQRRDLPHPDSGAWPEGSWGNKVVLGAEVHRSLALGERRRFSLFRPDLTQASFAANGVFNDDKDLLVADTIFMSNAAARDLFAIEPGLSTELQVAVSNPEEIDTIASKINDRLPGTRVITRNQMLKSYRAVFSWRSGFGFICLLASLVSFAILAWDKATGLSVEDLREVGILKVIGWQTGDIMMLRFLESFTLSAVSLVAGYLAAWVHILYFDGILFRPVLLGWSVLRPVFHLAPPFRIEDVFVVLALVIVPYLCATVIPAWRAATVPADSVI